MKAFILYYVLFQVIEFVQFKERLQHSNQYLVARVEAPILQLKQNADNVEEAQVIFYCTTSNVISYTLLMHLMRYYKHQ